MIPDAGPGVAEPPAAETPALADWECDKENVRPDRAGRDAGKLTKAVLLDRESLGATVAPPLGAATGLACSYAGERQSRMAEFEATLASMPALDDPGASAALVQVWSEYARWAAEWFPADPRQERSVLERATQHLAGDPGCVDDPRHLTLWLRLADMVREPQELFSFLWTRGIGLTHAKFYEAWAVSLERQRRFAEAEEALVVGIARGAAPTERLASARECLGRRIADRVRRVAFGLDGDGSDGMPLGNRPVMNELRPEDAVELQPRPTERVYAQPAGFPMAHPAAPGYSSMFAPRDDRAPLLLDGTVQRPSGSIFDCQADWLLPPATEAVGYKENAVSRHGMDTSLQQRKGWRGQPSRQRGVLRRSSGFEVFIDEEFQDTKAGGAAEETHDLAACLSGLRLTSADDSQTPGSGSANRRPTKVPRLSSDEVEGGQLDTRALGADENLMGASSALGLVPSASLPGARTAGAAAAAAVLVHEEACPCDRQQPMPVVVHRSMGFEFGAVDAAAVPLPPKTPHRQRSSVRMRLFGDSPPGSDAPSPRTTKTRPRRFSPLWSSPEGRSPLGSGMAVGGGIGPPSSAASTRLSPLSPLSSAHRCYAR